MKKNFCVQIVFVSKWRRVVGKRVFFRAAWGRNNKLNSIELLWEKGFVLAKAKGFNLIIPRFFVGVEFWSLRIFTCEL